MVFDGRFGCKKGNAYMFGSKRVDVLSKRVDVFDEFPMDYFPPKTTIWGLFSGQTPQNNL